MNLEIKLSNLALGRFNVFGYCPQCGDHNLVNIKQYSRFTLEEMNYKAECQKCKNIGIDVSVVKHNA